jgi:hypothetical protein
VDSDTRRDTLARLFLFLSILSALTLFYLPMMKNWFFSDDIHWIWSSATVRFKEIFFVPERYRAMASNFTPMLGASFKIDWTLFKMNPEGYFLHSMFSLLATTVVFYLFLRLYASRTSALAGVLLFLLSPFTLVVASWFSTRHYLEGLFWALLSLFFFVTAERKEQSSFSAGLFYLFSSLNKEVYVVLPAVAFILATGYIRKRLKHTLPLWLGLILYAVWRVWMMKGLGGYPSNQQLDLGVVLPLLYKTLRFFSLQWFGDYAHLFSLLLVAGFLLSLRNLKALFVFLILCIPILPVTNILDTSYSTGRYFFHLSVFLIFVACLLTERQSMKRTMVYRGLLFSTLLLVAVVSVNQDIRISSLIRSERLRARESALVFIGSQKSYIPSEQPSWFYESLRKIHREFFGKDITTRLVPPEPFLPYADPARLREIKEAGVDIPYDRLLASQEKFRKGPLTVTLTLDDYKLTWDFGPDKRISYIVLRGQASGLYYNQSVLRATGSITLSKMNKDSAPDVVYLRILYPSEKGEEVVSPEFELRIPGRKKIEYSQMS